MATRRPTTERPRRPQFETSPERIALISDTLTGLQEAGGLTAFDAFTDADQLRRLAGRLRLPYLALQLTIVGHADLTAADVDEYNAWRASLDKRMGVR